MHFLYILYFKNINYHKCSKLKCVKYFKIFLFYFQNVVKKAIIKDLCSDAETQSVVSYNLFMSSFMHCFLHNPFKFLVNCYKFQILIKGKIKYCIL